MNSAPLQLADATRAFLRDHAPFDAMSDDVLDWAIPRLSLVFFPKDATILTAASGPVSHLHLIHRGRVGSRPDDPRAEPDATLGPGELFPVGALSAGGATTKIFHAVQDTFCYVLPRARPSSSATAPRRSPRRSGPRWPSSPSSTASAPRNSSRSPARSPNCCGARR